jgi:hypothetical protein
MRAFSSAHVAVNAGEMVLTFLLKDFEFSDNRKVLR